MNEIVPLRGRVYRADLGNGYKPWLVVSNNHRNRAIGDVIVVRITTTQRELKSWVPLSSADAPLVGYVNCDDIGPMFRDDVAADLGALSPETMVRVREALMHSLSLT